MALGIYRLFKLIHIIILFLIQVIIREEDFQSIQIESHVVAITSKNVVVSKNPLELIDA